MLFSPTQNNNLACLICFGYKFSLNLADLKITLISCFVLDHHRLGLSDDVVCLDIACVD